NIGILTLSSDTLRAETRARCPTQSTIRRSRLAARSRCGTMRIPLPTLILGVGMLKSSLLSEIQNEILRHDFGTYVDEPPTIAQGGKGIIGAGCPACKKRLQSMNEFLEHLAKDAMPSLLDRLSTPEDSTNNMFQGA